MTLDVVTKGYRLPEWAEKNKHVTLFSCDEDIEDDYDEGPREYKYTIDGVISVFGWGSDDSRVKMDVVFADKTRCLVGLLVNEYHIL